jgi:hypothetical protein
MLRPKRQVRLGRKIDAEPQRPVFVVPAARDLNETAAEKPGAIAGHDVSETLCDGRPPSLDVVHAAEISS